VPPGCCKNSFFSPGGMPRIEEPSETAVTTPRNFICPETAEPCVNPHCTRVKCLAAIRVQFDKEQADKEAEKQRESAHLKELDHMRSPPPAPAPPPKQGPTLIKKQGPTLIKKPK
jgi:hypothetical protein